MNAVAGRLVEWWRLEETRRQGERFGFGVALALSVLSVLSMVRGLEARMEHLALAAAVLLALTLIMPRLLSPFAWIVEQAFQLIVKTMLYVMLVLVFIIMFTPAGIAIRILRKDPLETKLDPQAKSYWSEKPKTDPQRAEKQF